MSLATLTSAIQAKLALAVAAATLIDLSNQRDTAAVVELTTRTQAIAEDVAAEVQAELGDVDDAFAVAMGTKLALIDYASIYALNLGAEANDTRDRIIERLSSAAEGRRNQASVNVSEAENNRNTQLDDLYPSSKRNDDDVVGNQGGILF